VRLEFNSEADPNDPASMRVPDVIPRQVSTRLGVADLDAAGAYSQVTISYTLTQADIDAGVNAGTPINSVAAVMGIEAAGHNSSTGHILFDDFVFEVNSANVVVVGNGHATAPLKGDVDLSTAVDFADIPAFIAVLQAGGNQAEADCDCDGDVDFADIPAFIAILQQGG
jgi:hypothetical protein